MAANQTYEPPLGMGDWVTTPDGQTGLVTSVFEMRWDTERKGAGNTRTVAKIEGREVDGYWFLDTLRPARDS